MEINWLTKGLCGAAYTPGHVDPETFLLQVEQNKEISLIYRVEHGYIRPGDNDDLIYLEDKQAKGSKPVTYVEFY